MEEVPKGPLVHGSVQASDGYSLSRDIAGLFIRLGFCFYQQDEPDQESADLLKMQENPVTGQEHGDSSVEWLITGPWLLHSNRAGRPCPAVGADQIIFPSDASERLSEETAQAPELR